MKEFFALLSFLIVLASYPIYGLRIWQRKVTPNIASWAIFVLLSVSFLLSYKSSGAEENALVTYGPVLGTISIFVLCLLRSSEKKLSRVDMTCIIIAITSIFFWFVTKENVRTVQYALYLALLADLVGIIPTIVFLKKDPSKDRPAMWVIFSLGYLLSIFSISNHTFANWSLPVFMVIVPAFVWIPLVKYRLRNKIPLKEWI